MGPDPCTDPTLTFDEALAYLASLAPRGWRLGLDRMDEFVRRAGLARVVAGVEGPRYVHVTGTNGKGSATAFAESILVEMGLAAGGYYSPYVFDPRERVSVGRRMISPGDFARHVEFLRPVGESLVDTEFGGVTEFEVKTALGFRHWAETGCAWVALEVGLGGRLDATNVVSPAACAIVTVALDHTNILGGTVEAIAAEKAGIVKPGIPVVLGEMPEGARRVIEAEAAMLHAPAWRVGAEVAYACSDRGLVSVQTPAGSVTGLHPGIEGSRMAHNLAVALGALHAAGLSPSPEAARLGAERAFLPGRMQRAQWRGVPLLLDGAHNAQAAHALAETLRREGRPIALVAGMSSGHDPVAFFEPLLPLADSVHLAPLDTHRALRPEEIAASVPGAVAHGSVLQALHAAEKVGSEGLIVVTGSFYLVGEVGALLSPPSPTPCSGSR